MTVFPKSMVFFSMSILIGISACATSSPTVGSTGFEKQADAPPADNNDNACKIDSDCVLVPADCCGCNQGGKQRAINKKSLATDAKKRKEKCVDTFCIQMISKDPSCKATHAKCVRKVCVVPDS